VGDQPTNGPYHWGNPPKRQRPSVLAAIIKKLKSLKGKGK
jgi:hypothetical protein